MATADDHRTYSIRQLCREFGATARALRFYEDKGLLTPARKGQTRVYDARDRARLKLILRGRRIGFTLQEIRDLLGLTATSGEDMATLKARAEAKLHDVEDRIQALNRMRDALQGLVAACPGHGALERCPILAALSEDPA